jgi:hypothetical protein
MLPCAFILLSLTLISFLLGGGSNRNKQELGGSSNRKLWVVDLVHHPTGIQQELGGSPTGNPKNDNSIKAQRNI